MTRGFNIVILVVMFGGKGNFKTAVLVMVVLVASCASKTVQMKDTIVPNTIIETVEPEIFEPELFEPELKEGVFDSFSADTQQEAAEPDVLTGSESTAYAEEEEPEIAETRPKVAGFFPASITPKIYKETKEDIGHFISSLNLLIKARKYNEWRKLLDDDYYSFINSPEYLRTVSNADIIQVKKIVLTDAYDYFMNVVVPARSNDKVDDIEFINENRIKAVTMNNGRRIVLYDLEKRQDGWKIVMPNSKPSLGE